MPPAAIIQAIIAPNGPVAVAKVLGREKIPAPTIDPTTIAVNAQKENFCTDAGVRFCSGAGESCCPDGGEYFRCADPMRASRPPRCRRFLFVFLTYLDAFKTKARAIPVFLRKTLRNVF